MKRILLSTTSYQDTPGDHHALLESQDFELVRERGPLPEERMLELREIWMVPSVAMMRSPVRSLKRCYHV